MKHYSASVTESIHAAGNLFSVEESNKVTLSTALKYNFTKERSLQPATTVYLHFDATVLAIQSFHI